MSLAFRVPRRHSFDLWVLSGPISTLNSNFGTFGPLDYRIQSQNRVRFSVLYWSQSRSSVVRLSLKRE